MFWANIFRYPFQCWQVLTQTNFDRIHETQFNVSANCDTVFDLTTSRVEKSFQDETNVRKCTNETFL